MKKETKKLDFDYRYEPMTHKHAPYTVDGVHYGNRGDFMEICRDYMLGLPMIRDGSTPFDIGSDIPELSESVKSSTFSLADRTRLNATDYDGQIEEYFNRTASKSFSYVTVIDDEIIAYIMNEREFRAYLKRWSSWSAKDGKIRGKRESLKMLRWLEMRVTE